MGVSGSDVRRAELVAAYDAAVAADDVDGMAAAALGLTELQEFGPIPGRLPAFLHQAYERSAGRRRVELAIAIARAWSYGASPERAKPFVDEALAAAEAAADPALLAAALDAQLLTKWGPADFAERAAITQRLEDVVAHVADPEVQMTAHLWRLTTALEALDIGAARRQLRGLEALAEDTGSQRVRFFAASRRAMYALLVGDVDLAERALADTIAAGEAAEEPDTFALRHAFTAWIARQRDDPESAAAEAAVFEEYADREGVPVVAAEGALIWLVAGDRERAARLMRQQTAGGGFDGIADGVDWMFSVACLTEVAAALGDTDVCEAAILALTPYAGRGVVDAGAVKFGGVVDDYLALAAAALGDEESAAAWRASAAAAYRRVGASWWLRRCELPADVPAASSEIAVLRSGGGGVWEVGREGATVQMRELKGFHYLRLLIARPHLPIPARELSDEVGGHAGESVMQPALDPALDRRALAAYRARLDEIDADLDAGGDTERLETEREALLGELRAAAGLGRRARVSGGSDERARVAVRKAIAAAVERIRGVDASLGRLLEATVTTGTVCCYEPDPDRPVAWRLD